MLLQVLNLCNQVLILGQLFFSGSKAVDLDLKKFMEDQDKKNEMFFSAMQSVENTMQSIQEVNEGHLQFIKDLSQQIGKMSPPQCEPALATQDFGTIINDDVDDDCASSVTNVDV